MHLLCSVQPCELYYNQKPPNQYLFVASAALYALTGDAYYRGDADSMWPAPETFPILQTYLYNWNNVITQVRTRPLCPSILVPIFSEGTGLYCVRLSVGSRERIHTRTL